MILEQKAIRDLSLEQLKQEMLLHGEPAFRAKQVYEWIWKKSVRNFEAMVNIPKTTREWLNAEYSLRCVEVAEMQVSKDRTI